MTFNLLKSCKILSPCQVSANFGLDVICILLYQSFFPFPMSTFGQAKTSKSWSAVACCVIGPGACHGCACAARDRGLFLNAQMSYDKHALTATLPTLISCNKITIPHNYQCLISHWRPRAFLRLSYYPRFLANRSSPLSYGFAFCIWMSLDR